MKWLGKHIIDIIAHFRSDVYLDSIASGTVASGGHLGLDSNDKIVKSVGAGDYPNYAKYRWSFSADGGAISTINMTAITALPIDVSTFVIIDGDNSYIVVGNNLVTGNAGATIEIGMSSSGGGAFSYLPATDTDFFMAPTAYNASNFARGGCTRGLSNVGYFGICGTPCPTAITFKIAGGTLTGGIVDVYIGYKLMDQ